MKTELMLTTRPIRYCFLISDRDLDQFLAVAVKCCAKWGGINNLIVALDTTQERSGDAQQLIAFARQRYPDYFVNALSQEAQESAAWKKIVATIEQRFPGKPLLSWDRFCQEDQGLHPVSLVSPEESLFYTYDEAMPPFVPSALTTTPTLPRFVWSQFNAAPSDLVKAAISAAFGDVSSQDRLIYPPLRLIPIDGLEEAMLRAQMSKDPFGSLINLTLKELKCLTTVSTFPSLAFDIVIAQGVRDFCLFWNLRAFSFGHHWLPNRRVLLLTKEQLFSEQYFRVLFRLLKEYRETPVYLAEQIKQRAKMPDIQAKLLLPDLDVVFHYQRDDEIRDFLQAHEGLQIISGRSFQTIRDEQGREHQEEIQTWKGEEPSERPLFYAENRIEGIASYYEYAGEVTPFFTEVSTGDNTLHVPSSRLRPIGIGHVRKDIIGSLWQSYLPSPSVASLITPSGSFHAIDEHVESVLSYPSILGGVVASTQKITFTLPETWDMYRAYFHAQRYEVSPSDKMTYAFGLLNLAGGLELATVFRSQIAYRLLDALAMRASQKLARELIRLLPDAPDTSRSEDMIREMIVTSTLVPRFQRNPKSFSELKGMFSGSQKRECLEVLSELVRIQAIQRGWTLLCPHCRVSQWYGLESLNERMVCQGCLQPFDVPLKAWEQADADRPLQYALNPLTDRAMDQDILPVVVALLALRTRHPFMAHVVPGMNFKERGMVSASGDFDFLYVYQQMLYGGECKNGQILKPKDIHTAEIARQLGFRAFFFATLSSFSIESKQLVSEFQQSLRESYNADRPFDVFLLEEQEMFSGPLPENIPQSVYQELWSQEM